MRLWCGFHKMAAVGQADLPGKVTAELSGHQGPVRAVRFNRDGNYCLTCGSDKTVKLWNPHTGLLLKTYVGHGQEVLDTDSAYDNSRIVTCGGDKTIISTDVSTGKIIRKYRGHTARVNCVKMNDEATLILSGSYDSTVRAWDSRSRMSDAIQVMDDAKDSVPTLQLLKHEILSGSVDGKVRRYDVRYGRLVSDTINYPVTSVCFSRDEQCVLVSSLNSKLRLLDKSSGDLLNEYTGHVNNDYKLDSVLSHTDGHVVSGSEDGRICVWDLVEGSLALTLDHDPGSRKCVVYSVSYHPKHPCLLSAGSFGAVKVWKPVTWDPDSN